MIRRSNLGLGWMLALAIAVGACGKTADTERGGESHFLECKTDTDCRVAGEVCVRERPSDALGECRPSSDVNGSGGAGGAGASGGSGNTTAGGGGTTSSGGATSGGSKSSSGGSAALGQCSGACCPSDSACYGTPSGTSGRECLALHENTGEAHIQLRQTSTNVLAPSGLAIALIQHSRNQYIQLPLSGQAGTPACLGSNSSTGGRFIQLLNLAPGQGEAVSGYSLPVSSETVLDDLASGLCMVSGTPPEGEGFSEYWLGAADMSDASAYPPGLPPPRALADSGKDVQPVRYKRLSDDFQLATERTALLARLAPSGDLASYTGVFHYDSSNGRYHAYAPVADMVQHAISPGAAPTIIPVRELETRLTFNDPEHPNCAGVLQDGGTSVQCNPAGWGSLPGTEPSAEQQGYMLITELEQQFEPTLDYTLCVVAMTVPEAEAQGFLSEDRNRCASSSWDPQAANNAGLPLGDWCAATNSPATASCHDAFRYVDRLTFSATKVRLSTTADTPELCGFQ